MKKLYGEFNNCVLRNDVLLRRIKFASEQESSLQAIVPESWRETLPEGCHDDSGYMDLKETLEKVRIRYFLPGLYHNVEDWCKRLPTLSKAKLTNCQPSSPYEAIQSRETFGSYGYGYSGIPSIEKEKQICLGFSGSVYKIFESLSFGRSDCKNYCMEDTE